MKRFLQWVYTTFLLIIWWICFWYNNYWFSTYKEWESIEFSCAEQCYLELWDASILDYVDIDWNFKGNWQLVLWAAVGDQLFWINQWEISGLKKIQEEIELSDIKAQLPENTKFILVFGWSVSWDIDIEANEYWFIESLDIIWDQFWTIKESFTPYSINLRYWTKVLWTSIVAYWYVIFFIVWIIILLFSKHRTKKLFYLWLWLFLFIGIRNVCTYTWITHSWVENFSKDKTLFDLWDYLSFTDKIRTKLKLDQWDKTKDDCHIYIKSFQDWPYVTHWTNYYLKPCETTDTIEKADYLIYYKTTPEKVDEKKTLINSNGNYLLKNK